MWSILHCTLCGWMDDNPQNLDYDDIYRLDVLRRHTVIQIEEEPSTQRRPWQDEKWYHVAFECPDCGELMFLAMSRTMVEINFPNLFPKTKLKLKDN